MGNQQQRVSIKGEDADMPGNPFGAGSDSGALFLQGYPVEEGDDGEDVVLAAIYPDGGYERCGSEVPATLRD